VNGFELRGDLLAGFALIWLACGLISAGLAYVWARRPFDLKHFCCYLLLGPSVLVAVVILIAGYFITSPWAESHTVSLESSAGSVTPTSD
jgi:hypothetical protein